MKLIVFLAIILLIAVVVYMAMAAVRAHGRKGPKEWTLHLEETPDSTEFWLVKGQNTEFIGRAIRKDPNYSLRYIELEAEASDKRHEWNAANRVTRNLNK